MNRFIIETLIPEGVTHVTRCPIGDERGSFTRLFCVDALSEAGWRGTVAQTNLSVTNKRGTVRGLHFQHSPYSETKLVLCMKGAVWDVAIDVRHRSKTLLRHVSAELSADNGAALLIQPGFAHGFQALTDEVQLLYFHSAAHVPTAEAGLNPFDPALAIEWPLPPSVISDRDRSWAPVGIDFHGVTV